jgi:DNA-binding NarL/FixJ family response regulator
MFACPKWTGSRPPSSSPLGSPNENSHALIQDDDEKIGSAIKAGAKVTSLKTRPSGIYRNHPPRQRQNPTSPYLAQLLEHPSDNEGPSKDDRERRFSEKYRLTDLELKVLQLVTEGLNNEEISRVTHVARETIKGYLKGLFRKLQVKNRTEAAVLAVREGLD